MYHQQIFIVGAGIVGLSTAYALLKHGIKHVTVLEQAQVDHKRATSHGLSRLLRFEYGSDMLYTEMVQLSLKRWRNLERIAKRPLYTPTGLLVLGNEDDNYTKQSYHLLRELGFATQRLSHNQCTELFPQFNTQPYDVFTYNEEAGILHASTCLHTLKELIFDLGGHIYENQGVSHILHDNQKRSLRVQLFSGDELFADRLVLTVGPWLHHLLGELALPIHMTRQYLLYFANLPLSSFELHTFPAFIADDLYGFPIHSSCTGSGPSWLKAASHTFGKPIDPDATPFVDERMIQQITKKLCLLLPGLQQAELIHVDSCMYDVSPDEDFILDYVPDDPRIVFATGLTGHGFKFGPLLGEILMSLLCHTKPPIPTDRFRLARFDKRKQTPTSSVA